MRAPTLFLFLPLVALVRRCGSVPVLPAFVLSCVLAGLAGGAQAAPLETEVTLTTPGGTLSGTERVPPAHLPVPVVLIISGSGQTDRNGNTTQMPGANDCLKLLAEALARNGIATLRYDRRGVGRSAAAAGHEEVRRFEHHALDAAGWIAFLRRDPRFGRVIVAGHNDGSLIGMLASRQAGADAFISLAGVARPIDEVLHDQLKERAPAPVFEESERILKSLREGTPVDEMSPTMAGLYRPAVQPYMMSWLKYVPRDVIATLTMPVMIVQGTSDLQVQTAEANALAAAHPGARLVIIDGMNHLFKMVGRDKALQMASYSSPEIPVAPQLVAQMSAFIKTLPAK